MGLDNPLHIIFIVVALLLLFGAKRLPEIGRSLGTGMREFKQSVTGEATGHSHDTQPLGQQPTSLPPGPSQQAPRTATDSAAGRAGACALIGSGKRRRTPSPSATRRRTSSASSRLLSDLPPGAASRWARRWFPHTPDGASA